MDSDRCALSPPIIELAIKKALAFLKKVQLPHGEFKTLLASDVSLSDGVFDGSPFVTSFVLHTLSHFERNSIGDMADKALRFLEDEMELGGVWRYYSVREWKHCRIPPDLDDTATASYALRLFGRRVPSNRWIFQNCRDSYGRYQTWIVASGTKALKLKLIRLLTEINARWRLPIMPPEHLDNPRFRSAIDMVPFDDVDPVVNANVILYLGESVETRTAINYIIDFVKSGVPNSFSHYYTDPLVLFYMVTRASISSAPSLTDCESAIVGNTIARQKLDGSFDTPLSTALGSAVLSMLAPSEKATELAIRVLLKSQRDDGSWERYALYSGPLEHWGSEELSTAIALEAIEHYRKVLS
jgi:hypothetical protein